jgi:hypothetical protein
MLSMILMVTGATEQIDAPREGLARTACQLRCQLSHFQASPRKQGDKAIIFIYQKRASHIIFDWSVKRESIFTQFLPITMHYMISYMVSKHRWLTVWHAGVA